MLEHDENNVAELGTFWIVVRLDNALPNPEIHIFDLIFFYTFAPCSTLGLYVGIEFRNFILKFKFYIIL